MRRRRAGVSDATEWPTLSEATGGAEATLHSLMDEHGAITWWAISIDPNGIAWTWCTEP